MDFKEFDKMTEEIDQFSILELEKQKREEKKYTKPYKVTLRLDKECYKMLMDIVKVQKGSINQAIKYSISNLWSYFQKKYNF